MNRFRVQAGLGGLGAGMILAKLDDYMKIPGAKREHCTNTGRNMAKEGCISVLPNATASTECRMLREILGDVYTNP